MPRTSIPICLLLAAAFALFSGCKKNNPVTPPAVDPALVGVWYNSVDSVGFEIVADGTMKNLDVAQGKIEYAPPQDTVTGSLTLNIESARSGAISIQGVYKSHTVDSMYIATGTYSLSNNGNTLTLTLLLPLNGSSQTTFIYKRSSIGAAVS
ncbi:MAG: hypothetical protein WBZ48_14195 [Bacteroidota bacterium]